MVCGHVKLEYSRLYSSLSIDPLKNTNQANKHGNDKNKQKAIFFFLLVRKINITSHVVVVGVVRLLRILVLKEPQKHIIDCIKFLKKEALSIIFVEFIKTPFIQKG